MNILHRTSVVAVAALLICMPPSVTALGIGYCDPTKDLCIAISTDNSIAPQTQIKSSLIYDTSGSRSQLDSYEWLNPNEICEVVNLPIDLLTKTQIKNINFKISEVNHLALANCSVKTPGGKKLVAGILTLHLSYNIRTASFICTP